MHTNKCNLKYIRVDYPIFINFSVEVWFFWCFKNLYLNSYNGDTANQAQ